MLSEDERTVIDRACASSPHHRLCRVVGIMSGKGGVGKSLTSAITACGLSNRGFKVGLVDADLTGPSIPTMFGIQDKLEVNRLGFGSGAGTYIPVKSKGGIQVVSVNCLLSDEADPVLWRGDSSTAALKRFWTGTDWDDMDYLVVDMPPGTGDVVLAAMEVFPFDALVMVTTPQMLVSVIVEKAVKLAQQMDVPIVGLVQNMSYIICPNCGDRHYLFGKADAKATANHYGIPATAELPFDTKLPALADAGLIENAEVYQLEEVIDALL